VLTHGALFVAILSLLALPARADDRPLVERRCSGKDAQSLLEQGMAQQAELESEAALAKYKECLAKEPGCTACTYESGWSYWKMGEWQQVVDAWSKLDAADPDVLQYLPLAKENLALVKTKKIPLSFNSGVKLGERSQPEGAPISLLFLARRQSYNRNPDSPLDVYDADIQSPKSVHFAPDGARVFVNSLEGGRTVIYDPLGTRKLGVIKHRFTKDEAPLFLDGNKAPWDYSFPKSVKKPNEFFGRPVEIEHTHHGKFLWIPYYRRSFDKNGSLPSALAIVDTSEDKIVRVMAVGPISKYVKRSNTGRWLAVSHWGDNTVGLIDVRGDDPSRFHHDHLLVVEKRVAPKEMKGDRDRNCGFCVRGLAFSEDDRYLFVSRMKGGGIAVFKLDPKGKQAPQYLGSIFGLVPGPRDLEISSDGLLYVSCNASGVVARLPWRKLVDALGDIPADTEYEKRGIKVKPKELGAEKTYVGAGARSLRLSRDEKTVFVTVNRTSELVAVDAKAMRIAARIPVDSYPVGLELSPDGEEVWVTSQGRSAKGGNSVGVFQARYRMQEIVPGAHQ
jgi:sugar lactone lactonase YvrE